MSKRLALLTLASILAHAGTASAIDPATRCLDAKLKAAGRLARMHLSCWSRAVRGPNPIDTNCLAQADATFGKAFAAAEGRGGCLTTNDVTDIARLAAALAQRAANELVPNKAVKSLCGARQLLAGSRRVGRTVRAHERNLKQPNVAQLTYLFGVSDGKFAVQNTAAEAKGDCQSTGVETARKLFDSGLDSIYGTLGLVRFATNNVPSAAEPAETPGSPGANASNYPKLVTQFGGTGFDLNQATYTRFFYHPGTATPDTILILIPGFEGGGMSLRALAENLVTRALENGLRVEVWAYDRRGNQLEDRAGMAIAVAARDPEIGLDWMFGGELGLSLHPALAGLGRRAQFHDTHADTAFMANWTSLVFSRDIDAIVDVATAAASNGNVFLGGHSAGTGFTARYASTDFDLSGSGPAQPGFAKVRGLVLLEGGGGSTGTPPLSEAALDQIEDKADGGLFFAVRDNAPRCVDGTPCTVANQATDCAGKGHETCTTAVTAYSVVPNLLNPRILASAEPGTVQALDDPDTGQVILQVDHGSPGNNAIDVVPDLNILGILPQATPEGALGTFIDDDGNISLFALFLRTSVGGPGPLVGGLRQWQDVTEGPFPPALVPNNNNGMPPTMLPEVEWGQEKEITRIDRFGSCFIAPGSNLTDWYYPSAGLSTTDGFSLDSSQLSVGRSRRDIENLTQAANVGVPVIAFGGTNGLTPVPADYLPFAQSIGVCTAPSCDGTPRVVNPSVPNQAFPTFGNAAGGFEVFLSEGYAHIDIVAAEDDASNNVIGPLIDFLARNKQ